MLMYVWCKSIYVRDSGGLPSGSWAFYLPHPKNVLVSCSIYEVALEVGQANIWVNGYVTKDPKTGEETYHNLPSWPHQLGQFIGTNVIEVYIAWFLAGYSAEAGFGAALFDLG